MLLFVLPKDFAWKEPHIQVEIQDRTDGVEITVSASSCARTSYSAAVLKDHLQIQSVYNIGKD